MVKHTSYMFVTGPDVIRTVTHEQVSKEELGGAMTHNEKSGVAHFAVENDEACILLDPRAAVVHAERTNRRSRRGCAGRIRSIGGPELDSLVPRRPTSRTTCSTSSTPSSTTATFSSARALREEHPRRICAARRAAGGVVANQPAYLAGTLDIDASTKGARFRALLRCVQHPAGHLRGRARLPAGTVQEYGGIIRHGAKLLFAFAEATVPKLTVITRKAYGGAYCVMSSKHIRTDLNFAWPTAEIAVMGAEGAVNILYKRELDAARRRRGARGQGSRNIARSSPTRIVAAQRGFVDEIIRPRRRARS
jgi:propionyl-CoA carboxylase beta chain